MQVFVCYTWSLEITRSTWVAKTCTSNSIINFFLNQESLFVSS